MNLLKKLSKRTSLMVSCAGLVLAVALVVQLTFKESPQNVPATLAAKATSVSKHKKQRPPLPMRLRIPKINVDTSLEYVGLTPAGDVGAPKAIAKAAWFDRWPRPGEKGDAVIAGHYGWLNGTPAVFNDLNKLRKGDKLYIKDKKGLTTSFVVSGSHRYDRGAVATNVFRSNDNLAHLNLITCDGAWNETAKTFSKRLVVFADKQI